MNQIACIYPDRGAVLVAYLYDDIEPADRVAFETHVTTCLPCRGELAELRGVRSTLAHWAAPDTAPRSHQSPVTSHQSSAWWHAVPVWAQVAAAMLVLGASAAVANLDVRYDHNGLSVRTGWSKPAAAPPQQVERGADAAPWRAELAALRTELRSEMRTATATVSAASMPAAGAAMTDAEFGRRVRVFLADSERKQQNELALRLAQLQTDTNAQLQADRSRVNQFFREVTDTYGGQIMKQQRQINYLLPASQR
jgi:hypothetical protein